MIFTKKKQSEKISIKTKSDEQVFSCKLNYIIVIHTHTKTQEFDTVIYCQKLTNFFFIFEFPLYLFGINIVYIFD